MNNLIKGALRKPITVIVLVIGILFFSILSLQKIPIDILPKLNLPVIYVAQTYGGMSPQQMEGLIATRYQDQFLYVSGIKNIEVKTIQGLAILKLTFYPGTDMAQAAAEVSVQVSRARAQMPSTTLPPIVVRFDASSLPVGQIVFKSATRGLNEMQDLASTKIRPLFAAIPGVSSPPPFGGNARTIEIKVNPDLMKGRNISPDEIVKAIAENNTVAPAGNIRIGNLMYITPTNTILDKVNEFENIPIKKGAGPTVFIRDVAQVVDGADITSGFAIVNGKRAVYIPVTKRAEASTWDVVQRIKAGLPAMQNLLPNDVQISYEFDQSVYVINAVKSLITEGAIGALLTGLMILLFLGDIRGSIIVILTIPISLLSGVFMLSIAGQTINIMTLSGLALAIGILVDESTVTIENIHQHLEMKKPLVLAIRDACFEISLAKLLILLSILAVFAPAFLMTGIPQALFLPLTLSVGFSMLSSFILSQTLVPILCNWLMKPSLHHVENKKFEAFRARFTELIARWMKRKKSIVVLYLSASVVIIVSIFMYIGKDILPRVNSTQFQLRIKAPDGTRIERTEDYLLSVLDEIGYKAGGKENIRISSAYVGLQPSSYATSNILIFNSGPHEAVLQVALSEEVKINIEKFKDELRRAIHERMPFLKLSFEPIDITDKIMSQGSPTPIEIAIGGKNIEQSRALAEKLLPKIQAIPYLRDVQIAQPIHYPVVRINIDRERAGQLGLSANEVSRSLIAATSSSRFTEKNFWLDQKNGYAYQVQVEMPEFTMKDKNDLLTIPLIAGKIRPILADVATLQVDSVIGEYDRSGPRRLLTITANINDHDLGSAAADVNKVLAAMGELPKGLVIQTKGMVQLLTDTLSSLQTGLLLAIVVIFLMLTANYQSFKVSLVVLSTIPAVLAGCLVALVLTGSTLNLQSYMGIIMSVGVSVANAILLVTNAETYRKSNFISNEAALMALKNRLRPILMTSLAMIVGMIPMASGLGEAGGQTAPLGRAVIGGLAASTFAALLFLPLVFAAVQENAGNQSNSLDPDDIQPTIQH